MRDIYAASAATIIGLESSDFYTHMTLFKTIALAESWRKRPKNLKTLQIPDENLDEYLKLVYKEYHEGDRTQSWDAMLALLSRS